MASSSPKDGAKNDRQVLISSSSPKSPSGGGGGGQCLCSPTTHQGSFRCRFHRSSPSTWMMNRSKSMPSSAKSSKPLETV
ncbi:hypothetical protein IHE45_16G064000 [Dioscorea alata]|uniref:Uncharacterized protein n=1 Tax=Dioscorea alata TaxID=55571 RepID=A0ACB7UI41_DIOAL|nr:hypothetical protein IHE45_16G064000 [Dioscorea alata]